MHHVIHSRILTIRSLRILLDADLAQLYGIETRALVQAVRRNVARFPEDFMFELTAQEFTDLKSQSVISSGGHGGMHGVNYLVRSASIILAGEARRFSSLFSFGFKHSKRVFGGGGGPAAVALDVEFKYG